MPAPSITSTGDGPPVVLVHGVGVGPGSFTATAAALVALGHRVHVVARPGYRGGPDPTVIDLNAQVDEIGRSILALGEGPAAWVGVSGGATLGIIARIRIAPMLSAIVAHEPLVGSHAPALRRLLDERVAMLRDSESDAAAVAFVRDLIGPTTWSRLPPAAEGALVSRSALIRAEAEAFATFEPTEPTDTQALPVIVTVGGDSPSIRYSAAAVAATLMDGANETVEGVGHLPQVDDPDRFAGALDALLGPLAVRGAFPSRGRA